MTAIGQAQVGQMMKVAAENLQALSARNQELETENAHYRKKDQAEKIAAKMEEKGLEPELSFQEKVAGLLKRPNLEVVDEAVGLTATQTKFASVNGGEEVQVDHEMTSDAAATQFAASLSQD